MDTLTRLAEAQEQRRIWSELYAQLVALARDEGYTLGEIAKITNTTRSAVTRLARRAKASGQTSP